MFAVFNPGRQDAAFCRCYPRCWHRQVISGIASLPFRSYEAVLLYLIAVDAGAVAEAELPDRACCLLRASGTVRQAGEGRIGAYYSSSAFPLALVKVRDDIADDNSLRSGRGTGSCASDSCKQFAISRGSTRTLIEKCLRSSRAMRKGNRARSRCRSRSTPSQQAVLLGR
jgi:hypothetical protein